MIALPVFFPLALITEILTGSTTRLMSLALENAIRLTLAPPSRNKFRLGYAPEFTFIYCNC